MMLAQDGGNGAPSENLVFKSSVAQLFHLFCEINAYVHFLDKNGDFPHENNPSSRRQRDAFMASQPHLLSKAVFEAQQDEPFNLPADSSQVPFAGRYWRYLCRHKS